MTELTHEELWDVAKKLPSDFHPYGDRDRDSDWGPDCSCGCRWYHLLEGVRGMDWGVCGNAESPRAGLLTFEHQGCRGFEADEDEDVDDEDWEYDGASEMTAVPDDYG